VIDIRQYYFLHSVKSIKYFTITTTFVNIFTKGKIINNLDKDGAN